MAKMELQTAEAEQKVLDDARYALWGTGQSLSMGPIPHTAEAEPWVRGVQTAIQLLPWGPGAMQFSTPTAAV